MAERWEEIAHELGSYDLENVGRFYVSDYQMVRQDPTWRFNGEDVPSTPGGYVESEPACKRIAELEDLLRQSKRGSCYCELGIEVVEAQRG